MSRIEDKHIIGFFDMLVLCKGMPDLLVCSRSHSIHVLDSRSMLFDNAVRHGAHSAVCPYRVVVLCHHVLL